MIATNEHPSRVRIDCGSASLPLPKSTGKFRCPFMATLDDPGSPTGSRLPLWIWSDPLCVTNVSTL